MNKSYASDKINSLLIKLIKYKIYVFGQTLKIN